MNSMENKAETEGSQIIIGILTNISGSSATCRINNQALERLHQSNDKVLRMAGTIGSQLKIKVENQWLVADIKQITRYVDDKGEWNIAEIEFLGEGLVTDTGKMSRFRRGISFYPIPGSQVCVVTHEDLKEAFPSLDRAHIEIGTVYPTLDVRASLYIDAMLSKHFAIVGSTGTGKSTLLALILHKIIDKSPYGHIIVIDPHGEYSSSFSTKGVVFNTNSLKLPYWIMNFDEHCEIIINKDGLNTIYEKEILRTCLLLARTKENQTYNIRNMSVDTPSPYSMRDLLSILSDQMGKLENKDRTQYYIRLQMRIEELIVDPRFAFMFDRSLFFESLENIISVMLRMPTEGMPISIIDLSRLPSEVINTVVAVLSRIIFDFAVWSRNEEPRPILLVCEEAQRYLPCDRIDQATACRRILEKIAKEGRKYGISLGLVSQRPSDLSESALSQCGTMIAMRLNNERDQAILRTTIPETGRTFVETIQSLRNRECIICGEGVSIPIRVRVDNLVDNYKPESNSPVYSELWNKSGDDLDAIRRTILKWLNQDL